LGEARPGDRLVVVSVFERDRKLLEYLDGAGIRPGVPVEVSAADAEIELRTAGRTVRLERAAAGKVWVRDA
jgi:DtxR family Mn-dependent transcriptional regulator